MTVQNKVGPSAEFGYDMSKGLHDLLNNMERALKVKPGDPFCLDAVERLTNCVATVDQVLGSGASAKLTM